MEKLFPFLSGRVDFSKDFDDLKEEYLFKLTYSNFDLAKCLSETDLILYKKLFENILLNRSNCLLKLSQTDDFEFFETLSAKEMLDSISKKPIKISKHFTTVVSQSLQAIINRIYRNHTNFAKQAVNYFNWDISLHTLFGLSTFPALYGFFTTQEMCKRGMELIGDFLAMPEMIYLVKAMLASYLFCANSFNNTMWEVFHDLLITDNKNMREINAEKFENFLKISIRKAAPLLTVYHTKVIKDLYRISQSVCTSVLRNHFRFTFNNFFNGKHFFINEKVRQIAAQVFLDIQSSELIECFEHAGTGYNYPPAPPKEMRIPLVFSDRDVLVILEIIKGDPESEKLATFFKGAISKIFTNGYTPFLLDVYPAFEIPKKQKIEADEIIMRNWEKVKLHSFNNNKISPIGLIESHKGSKGFLKYGMAKEIIEFSDNISNAEKYIDMKFTIEELMKYNRYINNSFDGVLNNHLKLLFNELNINGGVYQTENILYYINEALDVVLSDSAFQESKYKLEIFCSVMDKFDYTCDQLIYSLSNCITHQSKIMMRELKNFRNNNKKLIDRIKKFMKNFDEAFNSPMGKQFYAMLDFMRYLTMLADSEGMKGKERDDMIDKLFRIGIIYCSTNTVFVSFFIFNKILNSYKMKYNFINEEANDLWIKISNEIISFLSFDNKVLLQYFQYKFDNKPTKSKK